MKWEAWHFAVISLLSYIIYILEGGVFAGFFAGIMGALAILIGGIDLVLYIEQWKQRRRQKEYLS